MNRFLICIFLCLTNLSIYSQIGNTDPTELCSDAPVLCELDLINGYSTTMVSGISPQPQPNPLCPDGQGAAHNIVWFSFVAGSDFVDLSISPSNCSVVGNDAGVQAGIYEDCSFATAVDCRSACTVGNFSMSGAVVPGQTYYIFIDGCSGSVCDIVVNINQGGEPYTVPDPTSPELEFVFSDDDLNDCPGSCDQFCYGGEGTFDFPFPSGVGAENLDYQWMITTPSGVEIREEKTFTENLYFNEEGIWDICARAVTGCDTSDYSCRTIEVVKVPDEPFDDLYVCENDYPVTGPAGWLGDIISGPGDYTADVESQTYSCDFQQTLKVISLELPETEEIEILTCETFYTVCNESYASNIDYQEVLCEDMASNGCDSTVYATVHFAEVIGSLQPPICENGQFIFSFEGYISPSTAEVSYILYLEDGFNNVEVASGTGNLTNPNFTIVTPIQEGFYTLVITLSEFGYDCEFIMDQISTSGGIIPGTPILADDLSTNPCILDQNDYSVLNDPNSTYIWTINPADSGLDTINNNTSITVDWNTSTHSTYTICVAEDNGCAIGPDSCFMVNIVDTPEASFDLPEKACINSDFDVSYTGTSLGATGTYNWNFDGGNAMAVVGETNYIVSFSSSGTKYLSLSVANGSCNSTVYIDSIEIVEPLAEPIVNCASTSNSITFTWDEVTGSTGYAAEIISIPGTATESIDIDQRTIEITSLSAGESVTIKITVNGDGTCPDLTKEFTCTADDCPPTTLSILQAPDTLCLDNNDMSEYNLEATIDPSSNDGTIVWSGPGITPATGVFRPADAGAGDHQIVVTYSLGACSYNESTIITVLEKPSGTIDAPDKICIADNATISYQGTFGSSAVWDFDGGTIISGSGGGPYEIIWDSEGSKTITVQTINTNLCSSEIIEKTIIIEPELNIPIIDCDAYTNDITFTWNNIENANGYEVTINGFNQGVQTDTFYFEDGLIPGDNVNIIVTAISDNLCPSVTSTADCQASTCAPVDLVLTPFMEEICHSDNMDIIPIDLQVTGGEPDATLTWSGDGVDSNGNFDPNAVGVGVYEITVTYNFATCEEVVKTSIEVKPVPTADFTTSSNEICAGDSITLIYTGTHIDIDEVTYQWSADGGQIEPSTNGFTATFDAAGDYIISLVVTEAGCISEVVEANINVDNPITDPEIDCSPQSDQVTFNWEAAECAQEYIIFVNNAEVGTQSTTSYTVTGLSSNESVDFKIIVVSSCACGDATFETSCAAADCLDIVQNIDDINPFCYSEATSSLQLNTAITGGDGTEIISWIGDFINSNGSFDAVAAGVGTHEVTAIVKWNNCTYEEKSQIIIYENPTISLNSTDPLCPDDENGSIELDIQGGNGDYTILVNNNPTTVDELSNSLSSGSYNVQVTDGNGCIASDMITLKNPIPETVEIGGNTDIIYGGTSMLNLSSSIDITTVDSIIWKDGSGNVICSGSDICEGLEIMPENDEMYCVTIIYNGSCQMEDCIEVNVRRLKQIYIPNSFSPNGDNVNDQFVIYVNDEIESIPYVRIYDRWGNNVYFAENVNSGVLIWDGTFKEKDVNAGVYVYMLEIIYSDGTSETIYGNITVFR